MAWTGSLDLHYQLDPHRATGALPRTFCLDRHDGPLRVLASLYPDGPSVCHRVLVHPPGGIVGGDELAIKVRVESGAHGLVATPGATRFYRTAGEPALQSVDAHVAEGGRFEWLPLETIAYPGSLAENRMRFTLAPSAEMIGWDVVALGLPASNQPFTSGRYSQHLELPGRWIERGTIDATDQRLLDSPLGLGGHRVFGTLWLARGSALPPSLREALLEDARELSADSTTALKVGCTSPFEGVVVVRAIAARTEALNALFVSIWSRWRERAWSVPGEPLRVWRT